MKIRFGRAAWALGLAALAVETADALELGRVTVGEATFQVEIVQTSKSANAV